ncbi:MAG: peptidylprolyl isomerase [Acidimicrobiales bacterium]
METAEEAQTVAERLDKGEDFAAVAREVSIDTGSGAEGGDLGCVATGSFVPEFEEAALAAEVGVVTAPVESQFGFHLIVTRQPSDDDLLAPAQEQISKDTTARMEAAMEGVTVELLPELGTWDPATNIYTQPQ